MLKLPDVIINAMKDLKALSQSSSTKPCTDIKAELAKIREKLDAEVWDVSECLRHYTDLVDDYYLKCPPFGSGNHKKDYQDFIELIGHSIVIGNYFLLEKWAVRYPFENSDRLAQPLTKYANTFDEGWQQLSQEFNWPLQAKVYGEYLVKSWMKLPKNKT